MKIGIVGLPNVGKTTLFNALTHAGAAATAYAYTSADANVGVVPVPDPRLWRLNEVLQTPRAVPATIDVVDIPGLAENASHGEGLGNAFLAAIRAVDRLSRDRTIHLEAIHHLAPDRLTKQRFDISEQQVLVDADERHGVALHARSTGPADSMDVILRDHRQFEVHGVG